MDINAGLTQKPTRLPLGARAKLAVASYFQTGSGLTALNEFIFPGGFFDATGNYSGSGWLNLDLESDSSPYRNINAYNSSIVMANINFIVKAFREAEEQVIQYAADGNDKTLPNHRFIKFIRRPNPYYNFNKMMSPTLISYFLDGNAYWFKERGENGLGQTRALYYIPHYQIKPRKLPGTNDFISYYEYNVNGQTYRIAPERIIHFRYEIDPYNTMEGRKILSPVLSEIYTDEEAARFTAALVKNTGIAGVVISPDTEKVKVEARDAEAILENWKSKTSGDNRGMPVVVNFPAKVEQMAFSPEQLQFKEIRRLPEERVSACFGLPAIVAGLGAGLDRSTYSNYEEALKQAYYNCVIPVWIEMQEEIESQLLLEFTGADESYGFRFDYSKVRALQESQDSKVNRTVKIWTADGITRSELREGCGYAAEEARDNVFFSEIRQRQASPQQTPSDPKQSAAKTLFNNIKGLLKAGNPEDNENFALEMQQEASVKDAITEMEAELFSLYRKIEEEGEQAAKNGIDTFNPEAEADRILSDIIKAVGLTLLIKALWGKMGKSIETDVIDSVTLRIGITVETWDAGAEENAKTILLGQANSYESALIQQSRKAIEEAIKGAANGESVAAIAKRIKSNLSGRSMYPGIYEQGYKDAKEAGASNEQAERAGESKARRYRAKVIAETETRTYQNLTTLESYAKSGVDKVKVTDGDGCGWKNHDDTDKAHNTTRLLTDAKKYALAHPQCKRRFYPAKK